MKFSELPLDVEWPPRCSHCGARFSAEWRLDERDHTWACCECWRKIEEPKQIINMLAIFA